MNSIVWHDDGHSWLCLECGMETQRTRMDPYPVIMHKENCKGREQYETR